MEKELLIFGAGGVLGTGLSEELLKKEYDKFYLFDFNLQQASEGNINRINIKDLSVEPNVEAAFKLVAPSKNKLFFLYSTVGGYLAGKTIGESSIDDFDKMLNMNLKANFLIAKYFSRLVKESAGGSVLFTSAFVGRSAEENKGVYGASKGGLIHLVETLALEGKNINLTANSIAPYLLDTPENRGWFKGDPETMINPSEVGELAHNIFTNFHFITGNTIQLTHRINLKGI